MQLLELVLFRVETRNQDTKQAAREAKAMWQKRMSCLAEQTLKATMTSSPAPHTHSILWPQGLKDTVKILGTDRYGIQSYFVLPTAPVVEGWTSRTSIS